MPWEDVINSRNYKKVVPFFVQKLYKIFYGISRFSKRKYQLWRNSHEEFRDEKGWFIDWEHEEKLENLWEKAQKIYTGSRIMHSIDDVPF